MTPAAAAELLAVGFEGASVAAAPLDELTALAPGGIVLFGRNIGPPGELRAMVAALRATQAPAPLIAIDQEGGRVARIGEGVAALPPAMAVGAAGDAAACERLGTLLGRDLARLGISVDLAPVADCALDPDNVVIGTRAYGGDPHDVARFAGAFARGLERGGVAPAVKHFPGHGATATDSHLALPHVAADAATLRARDLVPFAAAIAQGVPLVMSAHVVVDALDPDRPATRSPRILTTILRDELGFTGVAVTDCLQMNAIADDGGTVAGALDALAAGADLLLVSHSLSVAREVVAAIVAAVASGRLARERVEQARVRVRALRARCAVPAPFAGALDADEPAAIARRAVTVVRGEPRLRAGRPVTVVSFEGRAFDGAAALGGARAAAPSLSAALRARRVRSELLRVDREPAPDDVDLLLAHLAALGERDVIVLARGARRLGAQRAAIERILAVAPGALLIAAAEPWDGAAFPAARHVACIYGDDALMLDACADVLCGRAVPAGRLPVADVAAR